MTERVWNASGSSAMIVRAVEEMKARMETCKSCTGKCQSAGDPHACAAEMMENRTAGKEKIAKESATPAPPQAAARGSGSTSGEPSEIPAQLRKNPNRAENEFMLNLMVLRNSLARYSPATKERARLAGKTVWRDIRLMMHLVCKVQEALIRTMPERRNDYYLTYAQHGHYELKMNGPVRGSTRFVLISTDSLSSLAEAAVENECAMCLREGDEIGKCGIRKAMIEVAPPSEIEDARWRKCEYRDLPGKLFRDEEVTV